jgi:hypothetical protein
VAAKLRCPNPDCPTQVGSVSLKEFTLESGLSNRIDGVYCSSCGRVISAYDYVALSALIADVIKKAAK